MIPVDTVNEQLTLMADTLNETAISKSAAANLGECLTAYTKDKMLEIAEFAGYSVKKSHTKSRIAEDITEQIHQSLRNELPYLTKEETAMLTQLMEQPLEGSALEVFLPHKFSLDLIRRGWVYLFKSKDTYTLVLPEEVSQWAAPLLDDKELSEEAAKNQAIFEHFTALANLYGVFNETVAWSLWEKRYGMPQVDKETFFETADRMQGKLEKYQKENDLYYSAQHLSSEEAAKLEENRSVQGYFLPSEDDVLFYTINEVDSRTAGYEKMAVYLQEKYPEKEEAVNHLLHEIGMNAVLDHRIQELVQYLDETMNFTFESTEEFQEFTKLYSALSNDTRKWSLKGHTPNEISEMKQNMLRRQRPNGRPAQKQMPVRVNKIGRNEPCPCGSGKKYKRCHGR